LLRERLVATRIGLVALRVRDRAALWRAIASNPEELGTLQNDQSATRLVSRLCRRGAAFVDVGAHIGSIIAGVRAHDPSIRITAIEAVPEKAERLVRRFPEVQIHSCAVGEADGEVPFFVDPERSGYSSLGAGEASGRRRILVPLRTLDDLIGSGDVDVIKIDVEGAELGVLRGGSAVIERCRPTIMFESGPPQEDGLGYTKEALFAWFAERDYRVIVPNRLAHDDDGLGLEGFVESHRYPRRTTNYFAVAAERRLELRDRARLIVGSHGYPKGRERKGAGA
jgi:FkbM family methyltransferase